MPSERLDIIRDPERGLLREQAQAMLDLFAEDLRANSGYIGGGPRMGDGSDEKHLRDRVNRRLNVAPDAYENLPDSGAVPSAAK